MPLQGKYCIHLHSLAPMEPSLHVYTYYNVVIYMTSTGMQVVG